ncbi:MAG: sensor histidine kinase [Tepidiformaceae bacterium]
MRYPQRLATRLSVSFVLLFVITFSAVVLVTLYYAQRTFQTSIDDALEGAAQTVDARLAAPGADDPKTRLEIVDQLSSAAEFISLFNAKGVMELASSNTTSAFKNTTGSGLRGKLDGSTTFHTVKAGNARLRVIRYPLIRNGQVAEYAVVASPIPEVDEAVTSLAIIVIIAGVVGAMLAVIGTVWLSLREARPLKQLTEAVHATSASGFELSIPDSHKGSQEARELRQAFASLVERQRELLSRERAFFADSSHVLRTPLAVLQGDIEQLEQGVYGKERLEVVAQARASLSTMSRTVNGLLLLAREHETAPGSSWEVLDLSALLERLASEARMAAPTLTVTPGIAPGVEVAGDPHQLHDLFLSLIENACHYTPEGGTVEIVAGRSETNDAVVEIRDTGIGLSADDMAKLTDRFYRSPQARRMFPGGSGLGLAIAARIVGLHGGTLTFAQHGGGGTIARVELPLLV